MSEIQRPLLGSAESASNKQNQGRVNSPIRSPNSSDFLSNSSSYNNSLNSSSSNIDRIRRDLHLSSQAQTQSDEASTITISAFQTYADTSNSCMRMLSCWFSSSAHPDASNTNMTEEKMLQFNTQSNSETPTSHSSRNNAFSQAAPERNVIITGRYNLLTFFPQSLFEQFRRLANVYFLVLGTIAAIGEYTGIYLTAVEAVGILTPMMTVVLISIIKDGIEDIKRHRADNKINKKVAYQITQNEDVVPVEWADLLPGNLILLTNGDEVPADVVVIACGGIQGRTAYVETAAIDGETNLKPRYPCVKALSQTSNNNNNNSSSSSSSGGGGANTKNTDKGENNDAPDPLGISLEVNYTQAQPTHRGSFFGGGGVGGGGTSQRTSTYTSPAQTPPQQSPLQSAQVSSDSTHTLTQMQRRVCGVSNLSMTVCVEAPNEVIYGFNGAVTYTVAASEANTAPDSENNPISKSVSPRSPGPNTHLLDHSQQQQQVPPHSLGPHLRTETHTLTKDNLLLRGSTLRATEWCVCLCVYTGKNTKISLNSKQTPSKLSSVDRIVNKCLVIAIAAMLCVCLLSMGLSIEWVDDNKQADYLCLTLNSLSSWGYVKDTEAAPPSGEVSACVSGSTESVLTVFTFATLYNNFVCISMYVSLEMVYLCQSYFISQDITLFDKLTDTPAECHSSGMCADLGQIQYVMSDKTGTLTKNEMKLKRVSVAGIKYGAPVTLHAHTQQLGAAVSPQSSARNLLVHQQTPSVSVNSSRQSLNALKNQLQGRQSHQSHSHSHAHGTGHLSPHHENVLEEAWEPLELLATPCVGGSGGQPPSSSEEGAESYASHMHASSSMRSHAHAESSQIAAERNRVIEDFLRVLVCCNTCILMPDEHGHTHIHDIQTLKKHLQAESSDEVALVLAAAEHTQTLLTKREGNQMYVRKVPLTAARQGGDAIQTPTSTATTESESPTSPQTTAQNAQTSTTSPTKSKRITEVVEILCVNEFDSDRKRMSVLAKMTDPQTHADKYVLLVKGADSSVLPLCDIATRNTEGNNDKGTDARNSTHSNNDWALDTIDHIEVFASTGLRTLVFAQRLLTKAEAQEFVAVHTQAKQQVGHRAEALHSVAVLIEKELELLGAVGVEDELQDGVPEAINMLLAAGLNVWMITGDKPETAVAISQQCGLLTEDHEIEKLLSLSGEALRQRIMDLHSYLEDCFGSVVSRDTTDTVAQSSVVGGAGTSFAMDANKIGNSNAHPSSPHGGSITSTRRNSWQSQQSHTQYPQSTPPPFNSHNSAPSSGHNDYEDEDAVVSTHSMQNMLQANMLGAHAHHHPHHHPHSNTHAPLAAQTKGVARDSGLEGGVNKRMALIVDGATLECLFQLPDLKKRFTEAVRCVPTVIACRVSPKQKASLVRMIKTGASKPVTLSIGDGANDVGMIHEARVGVGIAGREGRHAANSSDFAIGQFRYLVPLLMEHGRFNYIRCSKLVLYSFFKNLVLVSVLFYFCLYSGYSGTVPLDSIVFSGYNFYLGLPIIALGALDFDIPRLCVYVYPHLAYATGKNGELLNMKTMFQWCLLAFIQGLIAFVVTVRMISGDNTYVQSQFKLHLNGPGGLMTDEGRPTGLFVFGYLIYTVLVVAMQYKIMMMTYTRTWINWSLWVLSFLGYFAFTILYGLFDSMDWFNVVPLAFQCSIFWLSILIVPVMMAFADMCSEGLISYFWPSSFDILVQKLRQDGYLHKYSNTEAFDGGIKPSLIDTDSFSDRELVSSDRLSLSHNQQLHAPAQPQADTAASCRTQSNTQAYPSGYNNWTEASGNSAASAYLVPIHAKQSQSSNN